MSPVSFTLKDERYFAPGRCEQCGQFEIVIVIEGYPKICAICVEARKQARAVEEELQAFFRPSEPRRSSPIKNLEDVYSIRQGLAAVNCPKPWMVIVSHHEMTNLYTDVNFQRLLVATSARDQAPTLAELRIDATKHIVLGRLFADLYVVLRSGL